MPRALAPVREAARKQSPLDAALTEQILATRFEHVPQRLGAALRTWPLEEAAVLDVGCSYGTCLVHFGAGSVGIDNHDKCVAFAQAIGLDARQVDV